MKNSDLVINKNVFGDIKPLSPEQMKIALLHEEMHKAYYKGHLLKQQKK